MIRNQNKLETTVVASEGGIKMAICNDGFKQDVSISMAVVLLKILRKKNIVDRLTRDKVLAIYKKQLKEAA